MKIIKNEITLELKGKEISLTKIEAEKLRDLLEKEFPKALISTPSLLGSFPYAVTNTLGSGHSDQFDPTCGLE